MIRGTTPTVVYKFNVVDVSTISVAYLSLKQNNVYIEKDITTATIDAKENTVGWTLTQAETLQLNPYNQVELQIRYKLNDSKAGASKSVNVDVDKILKGGEI